MRRIRLLNCRDSVAFVKPSGSKVLSSFSLDGNVVLERPYGGKETPQIVLHAKYDSANMSGIDVAVFVETGFRPLSSAPTIARLYRVSDSLFSKSLIGSVVGYLSEVDNKWAGNVPRIFLASNDTSGAETYLLEVELQRGRRKYRKSAYFNHIGVFDSVNRLSQRIDLLDLVKMEE